MFWFYVLYANRQYLVSLGYGGGQPNISQDLIKSLRFPAPDSLDEQRDIVQEIGRRLKNHDALVSTEVRRLELLKEYRQSLISSVVTGKIRITEDMV
jgi:type I restriction enzyme S subunit